MLIKNAYIYTMAGEPFTGDILIENGKIAQVGFVEGAADIDGMGLTAVPGFIDAHSHIGLWEDGLPDSEGDGNEATDPVTPQMRAIDGINPMDNAFKEAVHGGVTTVVVGPGSSNAICGQFVAIKTQGKCIDDMVIKAPCALKMALGENPKRVYAEQQKAPSTRMATAALIREAFVDAQNYMQKEEKEYDLKKEALCLALKREIPVKIHAHRADDILTAVRLAKEFNLDLSIDHCTEGYKIPEYIKGNRIVIGPLITERCKTELRALTLQAPKILHENGVEFAIMTDHPVIAQHYLSLSAFLAMREGLPFEAALAAITINAARACSIEDRVGSIQVGKDADILLFEDSPLDPSSKPKAVIIEGRRVV